MFQRRRETLCACEMLLPNWGFLPQISQTCAINSCPVNADFENLEEPGRDAVNRRAGAILRSTQTISVLKFLIGSNCHRKDVFLLWQRLTHRVERPYP